MAAAIRLRHGQSALVRTLGGRKVTLLPCRGADVRKGDTVLADVSEHLVLGRVTDVLRKTEDIQLGVFGWTTWACVFGKEIR